MTFTIDFATDLTIGRAKTEWQLRYLCIRTIEIGQASQICDFGPGVADISRIAQIAVMTCRDDEEKPLFNEVYHLNN